MGTWQSENHKQGWGRARQVTGSNAIVPPATASTTDGAGWTDELSMRLWATDTSSLASPTCLASPFIPTNLDGSSSLLKTAKEGLESFLSS